MGSGSCCVTSVWWHGTKLRARLALTAAFAHSNASCRPGPRPLSCCQHTDRLSWIISYLPNLSLQKRTPFGGGFKPRCHGSQTPSLFYGYFGPSLTTALSFPIHILLSFFLYHAFSYMPSPSYHRCLLVRANLKIRLTEDGSSSLE